MTRIISHEVLNTITPIVSLSDTLHDMTDDRNLREGIQVIGESARGLLGFVNGYRALSRVPVPQIHPFKFRPMLDYVLSPLLPGVEELGGRVDIALEDEDMVLFADEQLMRQVVANILKNALNALRDRFGEKAAPAAAPLDDVPLIRITAFVNASDNTEIHISNNGDPISDENADHIFDPFFTSPPAPKAPASASPSPARSCVPTPAPSASTAPTLPSPHLSLPFSLRFRKTLHVSN